MGQNRRPYWRNRGAKSVTSTQPPWRSWRRVTRIGVLTRYACSSFTTSIRSTAKRPKSVSPARSRSREQNTGSPSKRGKQAHTTSLRGLTSAPIVPLRSEEHTSELQSHSDLVCRLLLEKKKKLKP